MASSRDGRSRLAGCQPPKSLQSSLVVPLLILFLIYVAEGLNCTIFLPFFPPHALGLGLTPTQVGVVHGMYDISTLVSQFVIGSLITPATAKKYCFLGTCISAIGLVLFGFTGEERRPQVFFLLCVLIRVIMGLGASMVYACVIPLADSMIPGNTAVINSIAQSCLGVGFISGPPFGSALYSLGAAVGFEKYMTPFLVIGVLEFVMALLMLVYIPNELVSDCRLPKQQYPGVRHLEFYTTGKILIISVPAVIFYCLYGFQDVTLAHYIRETVGLKEDKVGFVYLWLTVSYVVSAVGSGILIKKGYAGLVLMFAMYGTVIGTFAYYPTRNLPRTESLMAIFATLLLNGTSMAALFGSLYLILEKLAERSGFFNYHVNKLLVAQLISIIRSTGKVIGALFFGGVLLQNLSFRSVSVVFAGTEFAVAVFVTFLLFNWKFLTKTFYTPKDHNSTSYLRPEQKPTEETNLL